MEQTDARPWVARRPYVGSGAARLLAVCREVAHEWLACVAVSQLERTLATSFSPVSGCRLTQVRSSWFFWEKRQLSMASGVGVKLRFTGHIWPLNVIIFAVLACACTANTTNPRILSSIRTKHSFKCIINASWKFYVKGHKLAVQFSSPSTFVDPCAGLFLPKVPNIRLKCL